MLNCTALFTATANKVALISITLTFLQTVIFQVLGQLFYRVDLIKLVSNVRPSVCVYVCSNTKSFLNFNEIWHVGRGQ